MAPQLILDSDGGWASQMVTVARFLIATEHLDCSVRIRHREGGGMYRRPWVMGPLVPTPAVHVVHDWAPVDRSLGRKVTSRVGAARQLLRTFGLGRAPAPVESADDASAEILQHKRLPKGTQALLEAWPLLSARMLHSGLADFRPSDAAEQVSVHYRLGDYRRLRAARRFHGLVNPAALADEIRTIQAATGHQRILLFSDEPALAMNLLAHEGLRDLVPGGSGKDEDIWAEVQRMVHAQWFVGTNSGVSVVAAIGRLQHDHRAFSETGASLPSKWFRSNSATDRPSPGRDLEAAHGQRVRLYDGLLR